MDYETTTIIAEVQKGVQNAAQDVLLATKRNGQWIETSRETFQEKVRNLALGLYELGIRKGDRISLHAESSTEWLICDQAILSLGAVSVPIYPTQPADQIKFVLENSKTHAHIVSNDELFASSKPIMKSISGVENIISIAGSDHKKLKNFEEILQQGKMKAEENPQLFDELRSKVQSEDLATLIYTSGTTGDPKGVMLSHNNIASNLLAAIERVPFDDEVHQDERMLSYLPLSHVFERLIVYLYLRLGYPIYFIENIDDIREDFKHVNPFYFATVPRLLEKVQIGIKAKAKEMNGFKKIFYRWSLRWAEKYDPEEPPSGLGALKQKLADKYVYSEIRKLFGGKLLGVVSGGAALSPTLFRFMNAIGLICLQGYGLTETSPVLAVQDKDHLRVGSAGPPLSNVNIKIGEDDEILAQGPSIMQGYFNDEKKTVKVLTEDGWLHTGDIGRLEDGYLFVTDRKKDVFKLSTGKYVKPTTVENRLKQSASIDQAMVIGNGRKFCAAIIVPDYDHVSRAENNIPNEDESLQKHIQQEVERVNSHLSPWETVKKFYIPDEPFSIDGGELTATLKVKRSVVQERYKDEIEAMYEEYQEV